MSVITLLLFAYFMGSVPFGLIFAKMMGVHDLRQKGSGNIGATNAMRVGGKKLGILTLIADLLKGFIAACVAFTFFKSAIIIYSASFVVVLGHIFPVWLRFKGGKGVATALGVILALNYYIFLVAILSWLLAYKFGRVSAVSAIFAIMCASFTAILTANIYFAILMCALSVLIIARHRQNLKQIIHKIN